MSYVYKVARVNHEPLRYFSAYTFLPGVAVEYQLGIETKPILANSKLLAFTDILDAVFFMSGRDSGVYYNLALFVCKAKDTTPMDYLAAKTLLVHNYREFWTYPKPDPYTSDYLGTYWHTPHGTCACPTLTPVKLLTAAELERVRESEPYFNAIGNKPIKPTAKELLNFERQFWPDHE